MDNGHFGCLSLQPTHHFVPIPLLAILCQKLALAALLEAKIQNCKEHEGYLFNLFRVASVPGSVLESLYDSGTGSIKISDVSKL